MTKVYYHIKVYGAERVLLLRNEKLNNEMIRTLNYLLLIEIVILVKFSDVIVLLLFVANVCV